MTVTILSGGFMGYVVNEEGDRWAKWSYRVDVDGLQGINGVLVTDEWAQDVFGVDANDPSIEYDMEEYVVNFLEADPNFLGGIASLDGAPVDGSSSGSTDGTVVADGSSSDGSSSDGTASTDGSSSDGDDGNDHTGVIGEST